MQGAYIMIYEFALHKLKNQCSFAVCNEEISKNGKRGNKSQQKS